MPNKLINETSPYLLQHAHNPVDWYPWGGEALSNARDQNKPIFLSIGYSACHWCHVMERESFENDDTAAFMNEHFINIKVDREERPDLDAIYMEAVQAMTGQGGWPMSVFLTPDGQPFYGGTYFPPEERYGMPSFRRVLHSVVDAYEKRRDQVLQQAQSLTDALNRSGILESQSSDLGNEILDDALTLLEQSFDDENGGFGSHPKFPQPMNLDFLHTQYVRTGELETLYMAERTLTQMAQGGIYDQLGGGFHRYSVDAVWLVPHFEKMLYDNAQLLRTYLHAWLLTPRPLYRTVVEQTVDYVLREMTSPEGGFYSSQDADSEGVEGKFFVWSVAEIDDLLDSEAASVFKQYYGVSAMGNFEGKNILNVNSTAEDVAESLNIDAAVVDRHLAEARSILFDARAKRIPPARDDKLLAEWNGLMIHALAECGVVLQREDALAAAQNAANFVLEHMSQADGRLFRSYKDGRASLNGYLEDYASFIRALVALYEADFDLRWLAEASRLTKIMFEQFHDTERGGFYQTGVDHEQLVVRRKDHIDNAIPSGNSMAAEALIRLSSLRGNEDYRKEAGQIALTVKELMSRQPAGFGRMLCNVDSLLGARREVAIVGHPEQSDTQALLSTVRERYLPNTVVALGVPDEESILPVLKDRTVVERKAAAYVCENYVCQLPVTEPDQLAAALASQASS